MDDIEGTRVSFFVSDNSDTTLVGTTSDHGDVSDIKLDEAGHFAGGYIEFDGVVSLHEGIRVADGATIVGDNVRDGSGLTVLEGIATNGGFAASAELLYAAQFEFAFFGVLEAVKHKATFGVVEETEVFTCLGHGDDVHETSGVVEVSTDFAINSDVASLNDGHGFLAGESVLQTVLQNEAQREAVSHFVGTSGGTRSPSTAHFGEHPMLGGIQTL